MSLAMLKVNFDQKQRDYLDYLVPFCHFLVSRVDAKEPISDSETKKMLEAEFGLRIPVHIVRRLLGRLANQGLLRKDRGVFYIERRSEVERFEKLRDDARSSHDNVTRSIQFFASTRYDLNWSSSNVEEALLAFLGVFSVASLRTWRQGTALPAPLQPPDHSAYLVHAFAASAHQNDKPLFEQFMTIVQGHMLANALLCPDLERAIQKFKNVTFYLDTPLVLRLMKLDGESRYTAAAETVSMVQDLGATVAIFGHTDEEVCGVLEGCIKNFNRKDARNALVREARLSGRTPSDLLLTMETRRKIYDEHKLQVYPTPEHRAEHQIDEVVLQEAIADEIDYYNPRALIYDVSSIRSVYARRRGVRPRELETAVAVLVTPNKNLVRASNKFGRVEEDESEVGPAISDYTLANVAWLKAPMQRPLLPEQEILASCYAFLEPSNNLWDQYLVEVDRLLSTGRIDLQHHWLLRNSTVAKRALVEFTLGDEDSFETETVQRIMERVETSIKSELKIEHEKEVLAVSLERETFEKQSRTRILELLAANQNMESKALELALQHDQAKEETLRTKRQLAESRVRNRVVVVTVGLFGVSLATLLLGFLGSVSGATRIAYIVAAAVTALVGLLGASSGWSLASWKASLVRRELAKLRRDDLRGLPEPQRESDSP